MSNAIMRDHRHWLHVRLVNGLADAIDATIAAGHAATPTDIADAFETKHQGEYPRGRILASVRRLLKLYRWPSGRPRLRLMQGGAR